MFEQPARERLELLAVLGKHHDRARVAFLGDAADLGVDKLPGVLRRRAFPGHYRVRAVRREHAHEPDLVGHPTPPDHVSGERRGLVEFCLGARGHRPVDQLLGGSPAEQARHPSAQELPVEPVAVHLGALEGDAQRVSAGNDRPCGPALVVAGAQVT